MRHWYFFPVNGIESARPHRLGRKMRHNLMPVEIEIDPMLSASALLAAKELAIKFARGCKIIDRKREMKWRQVHLPHLLGAEPIVEAFVMHS